MNILIINSIGKKKWGGGEKWMMVAGREFMAMGDNVFIGCRRNSVVMHRAESQDIPTKSFSIFSDFSLVGALQLLRFVAQHDIDVIIACQNRDVRVSGFARLFMQGRKPLIVARQGINRIGRAWKYKVTFTKFCDGIITNTQTLKELYDSYGWWSSDFVKVIHNGLDIGIKNPVPMDIKGWFDIPDGTNPVFVVAASRLAGQKNLELFIDAANEVLKGRNNYFFVVAGEGDQRLGLQQRINEYGLQDKIKLIGFINDVGALLASANIFVLTSLFEGMPNTVLEAMWSGLPVVCSNVNGVAEVVTHGYDGYLFEPGRQDLLVEYLLLLGDAGERQRVGRNGHCTIADNFSSKKMATEYRNHIKYLVETKNILT